MARVRRPDPRSNLPTKVQADLLAHLIETGVLWHADLAMPSGFPARSTTAAGCIRKGWLLPITLPERVRLTARPSQCERVAVVAPAGRLALKAVRPELDTGWSDEDRARMRTIMEGKCYGPIEADVCEHHPDELEVFRWCWRTPRGGSIADHVAAIDAGGPEAVRGCPACREKYDHSVRVELEEFGQAEARVS